LKLCLDDDHAVIVTLELLNKLVLGYNVWSKWNCHSNAGNSCGSKTIHENSTIILKIFLIVLRLLLSKVKYQQYKVVTNSLHGSTSNLASSSNEHCKVV